MEDEQGKAFSKLPPASRHRQGSITFGSNPSLASLTANRNRSHSMTSSGSRAFGKKLMRNAPPPVSSSHMFHSPSLSSMHTPAPTASRQPAATEQNTYPSRTRKIQRNRESLDLDDVMNGSDDEDIPSSPTKQARLPTTPRATPRSGRAHLSAHTRDLLEFLAEGPPEPLKVPDVPNGAGSPSIGAVDSGKKNPGRLQRMISKLTLGGSDKPRASEDGKDAVRKTPSPVPPLPNKPSIASLSPLANRPIPPRYPRPPSPPLSSPSQSSSDEPAAAHSKTSIRQDSVDGRSPDTQSIQSRRVSISRTPSTAPQKRDGKENTLNHVETSGHALSNATDQEGIEIANNHGHKSPASAGRTYPITPAPSLRVSPSLTSVALPPQTIARNPAPAPVPPALPPPEQPAQHPTPSGHLTDIDVREMHRLMSRAGSADECRLILDMFLARAGIRVDRTESPPLGSLTHGETPLENAVVELFLGGEAPREVLSSPRRLRSKRHKKGLELRPHTADGSMSPNTPQASLASLESTTAVTC